MHIGFCLIIMDLQIIQVLVLLYVFLTSYTHVNGQLTVTPSNVAAVAGPQPLILNCTTSSSTVALQWAVYKDDNLQTIISYNENIINIPYQSNFSILSGTDGGNTYHNLRLNDVQLQYGAMYACVDAAVAQNAFAHLVVLASDPICSTNLSSNGSADFGDIIHMACTVRYSMAGPLERKAQWAPVMKWRGPEGDILQHNESYIGVFVQYSVYVEVTEEIDSGVFTCLTAFEAPEAGAGQATNTPDYQFIWSSGNIKVEGKPSRGGLSAGQIIGITLGSTAFVALIVFFAVILQTKISKQPSRPRKSDVNVAIPPPVSNINQSIPV